jgi:dephospho-CoA kinase
LAARRTETRKWPPLLVVGLTGGIASGKSTVARMFVDLGATVIAADELGREVVRAGEPALAELAAHFGQEYVQPDGELNRRELGRVVFGEPRELPVLNRITHPRIRERLEARLRELAASPPRCPVVVLEAAVLVEAGWVSAVDRVAVVAVQPSVQVRRLIAGSRLTEAEARARLSSQITVEQRLRHADYRIDGERALEDVRDQVGAIWADLGRTAGCPAS